MYFPEHCQPFICSNIVLIYGLKSSNHLVHYNKRHRREVQPNIGGSLAQRCTKDSLDILKFLIKCSHFRILFTDSAITL